VGTTLRPLRIDCAAMQRLWDYYATNDSVVLESQFLPSLPTCVTWQHSSEHAVAVGTETGHILLQDCRVGVGMPDMVAVHTRPVNRLAFSPHQ